MALQSDFLVSERSHYTCQLLGGVEGIRGPGVVEMGASSITDDRLRVRAEVRRASPGRPHLP